MDFVPLDVSIYLSVFSLRQIGQTCRIFVNIDIRNRQRNLQSRILYQYICIEVMILYLKSNSLKLWIRINIESRKLFQII